MRAPRLRARCRHRPEVRGRATASSAGRADAGGFTLLELVVVIIIMGIMAAMILPEMRGSMSDAVLRSSSRDLVDVCGIAYSRAVSFNQVHRLRLETGSGKFVLEKRVRGGRPTGFVPVRDIPGAEGHIDARLRLRVLSPGESPGEDAPPGGEASPAGVEPSGGLEEAGAARGPGRIETVTFYPDGTAEERQIELRDREGFGMALRIHPITARVQVKALQRE